MLLCIHDCNQYVCYLFFLSCLKPIVFLSLLRQLHDASTVVSGSQHKCLPLTRYDGTPTTLTPPTHMCQCMCVQVEQVVGMYGC